MSGLDVTVRGITLPPEELSWRFSRSTGPGGQSVNTTDSRVELSFDLEGSAAASRFRSWDLVSDAVTVRTPSASRPARARSARSR